MDMVIHPRAAPGDRLRAWVGAFNVTDPPLLAWTIDGTSVEPEPLRPIQSVRTDDLLPQGVPPEQIPRAFTGVYEFGGLEPDTTHRITVESGGVSASVKVRTLPDALPTDADESFNVLLVSCFHAAEDRGGLAGRIVSSLKAGLKPHLTLLAGDQVYLDLPTLTNFPDDAAGLAAKFERDYSLNWCDPSAYAQVLHAAPGISIPDDHDYWNNYPHKSPIIQNVWSEAGRERWRKAAQAMLTGFQLPFPAALGDAVTLDVPPLSFFLADTRSNRDGDRRFAMAEAQHQQLDEWVTHAVTNGLFGIFISGQSVFQEPVKGLTGALADFELPNYGDFPRLMKSLQRLADEGRRPLLLLTGDVHWGRVASAQDLTTGRTMMTEVISSPTSLVTTLGLDTVNTIGGFFAGLFGNRDPWPRHPSPLAPPAFLASDALGGRFACHMIHAQKGNHAALLRFRQAGVVECRISYWPIHSDSRLTRPVELAPFQLLSF